MLAMVCGPASVIAATTPTTTTPTTTTPTTETTTTPTTTTPTTTTPTVTPGINVHWNKAVRIEPAALGGIDAVSCPSAKLCVAVDQSGDVLTTTRPTGGNGSWSAAAKIDALVPLTGVSCPTISFCAAVDADGDVLTSDAPTRGKAGWSKPVKIDTALAPGGGSVGLSGISCQVPATTSPTAKGALAVLCVAVDGAEKGSVLVSTDPAGGAHAWTSATIATGPLTGVSCASTTLCVAAGDQHYVSTNPTGGAAAWKGTGTQLGGGVLSAIDCPAVTICVGVGYGNTSTGLATATASPHGSSRTWKTVDVEAIPPVPGEGLLDAVGCATPTACIAVDGQDTAYTTAIPVGGAWSGATAIRPKSASESTAISCTTGLCVVVDGAGVETTGVIRS